MWFDFDFQMEIQVDRFYEAFIFTESDLDSVPHWVARLLTSEIKVIRRRWRDLVEMVDEAGIWGQQALSPPHNKRLPIGHTTTFAPVFDNASTEG